MYMQKNQNQQGSIIVSLLIIMIFMSTIIFALITISNTNIHRARSRILDLQSLYAAESGADAAIAQLNNTGDNYSGSGGEVEVLNQSSYRATFSTTVTTNSNDERVIRSTGKVYVPATDTTARYVKRIEVIAKRISESTASSMVSRNIVDVQSGVKDLKAKDIYVNGYIFMNRNTTNLIAENITVGGKMTGATNCSIGGTGNLVKPPSFVTPGQTKTKLTLAYNNCINPPGNNSNNNFDVYPNQNNISLVESTLIPFSQYMDSSYQNSPGGCSDWTNGTFPRDIPSAGNDKKTHYPDNGNGISANCGTNGNIQLPDGQRYNIKNNVHLRANLCATTACNPVFYNPDQNAAGIKFVFIEGNVNFASLNTVSGSGPIVFVIYGPDPASKTSVCPEGGAFYLGNSGTTSAKQIYILAQNGVCLDKTKFSTNPALGGVTGKNIYISTSPGTPFDLALDTSFPTSSIPINFSWKASYYRRF